MPARYYGYKKPSTANAKPATTPPIGTIGQWTPGALSNLPTTQGVSTSQANKITTNFTDLGGGKTGSLIDAPVTDLSQMTPAFAAKAEQALSQNAIPQNASGAQAPAALFAPNTNNPFAPNFSGIPPPNPFEQTAGAEGMPQQQKTSVFGAGVDAAATRVVNAALDFVQWIGKGDFARGMASLIVAPVAAGSAMTSGTTDAWVTASLKETAAGVVKQEAMKKGGVKASQTIIQGLSKNFKPSQAYNSIKAIMVGAGILYLVHSIIKDSTGTGGVGTRDVGEEGGGMVATACRDFFKAGDMVGYEECKSFWNDVKNMSASWTPYGIGAVKNVNKYQDIVDTTFKMYDEHAARTQAMGSTPETNANYWLDYHARVEADKTAQEKARVDYYNSERLRVEQEILAARSKSNSSERAADRKAAADLAAFWLDYQKKLAALEEEEMKKQAEYWLEYRKMVIKLQEETGRSRLGFGLLR